MSRLRVHLRTPAGASLETSPLLVTTFGQLKLSIILRHEVLCVSVLEAKDICVDGKDPCDSYVKVGLFPGSDPRDRPKTQRVPRCRNPIFLQTFCFDVSDADLEKRLLFTMWNSRSNTSMSALVGCFSFGVRSLMDPKKEVQGWYYLLGEVMGRKKHLKVPEHHNFHPNEAI